MIIGKEIASFRLYYQNFARQRWCAGCVRFKSTAEPDKKAYSYSILFPKTDFPVRPKSASRDDIQKNAKFSELYNWQRENLKGEEFILHDGPPYANGDLHMGHAVNKIIKDINNRSQVIQGNRVHYIPGWDCHGLPIELKALQKARKKASKTELSDPVNIRAIARAFALETVQKQKEAFRSWGIMADWEKQCYLTLDKGYVQTQLRKFYELYQTGLIFRALKPVYWSPSSRTALAEAELEYDPQFKSKQAYVTFPVDTPPLVLKDYVAGKKLQAIIWTTTPWTLVANRAICYGPSIRYSLVTMGGKGDQVFIVARDLVRSVGTALGVDVDTVYEFDGCELEGASYRNKLTGQVCPLIAGDHVTAACGTGLVHTAPAHGPDDFLVALRHRISVECNVDEAGRYVNLGPHLDGLSVLSEGQESVLTLLAEDVLHQATYTHAYPLDWRTKQPVILRASQQWFIDTAREDSRPVDALEDIQILPQSSEAQYRQGFRALLQKRPYWCISRQRAWGVPVPVLYHGEEAIVDERIIERFIQLLDSRGPDVWWTCEAQELLPEEVATERGLDKATVTKGKDIMDIWLDSGLSWSTLGGLQADLYCEGVDQLTGWFQASLLTALPLTKKPPYRSIFVHGFVVDDKKRKMSKSIGNVVDPATIIHGGKDKVSQPAYGVDTLRWWVASHGTQHSQIVISQKLLGDTQQEVIKIRNILKYLLGVLSDLDTNYFGEKPLLNYLDLYMLRESHDFLTHVQENYNTLKFNAVTKNVLYFISNRVSSLYCHCVKDRLYCSASESNERLSAQLVVHTILVHLLKSLGPILPHLVEEVWSYHPLYEKPFFMTRDIPLLPRKEVNVELMDIVLDLKRDISVLVKNDELKKYKVHVKVGGSLYDELARLNRCEDFNESCLNELLEISSIEIEKVEDLGGKRWTVEVSQTTKGQCLRCRKYNALDISDKCLRCENVVMTLF